MVVDVVGAGVVVVVVKTLRIDGGRYVLGGLSPVSIRFLLLLLTIRGELSLEYETGVGLRLC